MINCWKGSIKIPLLKNDDFVLFKFVELIKDLLNNFFFDNICFFDGYFCHLTDRQVVLLLFD